MTKILSASCDSTCWLNDKAWNDACMSLQYVIMCHDDLLDTNIFFWSYKTVIKMSVSFAFQEDLYLWILKRLKQSFCFVLFRCCNGRWVSRIVDFLRLNVKHQSFLSHLQKVKGNTWVSLRWWETRLREPLSGLKYVLFTWTVPWTSVKSLR